MKQHNYPLHIFLFLITVFTTMMAGTELISGRSFFYETDLAPRLSWGEITMGWQFSFAFLGFLTVHEFGHYLTAVYHRVRCSLPYYIPIFFPFMPVNIGSFGAVIRIREIPSSRRKYFDIGVAGPLAGFVVAVFVLMLGFLTLPPLEEFVYGIHPNFAETGIPTAEQVAQGSFPLAMGSNLLFEFLAAVLPVDASQIPPPWEAYHYPLIFVGYLTLFFTALNLLPIGQLDGGHVVYGLFGAKRAGVISRVAVFGLLLIGGTGIMTIDEFSPNAYGSHREFVLFQVIKFVLYSALVYHVINRIFKSWRWRKVLVAALSLLGIQALIVLIFPGIRVNEIWLLFAFLSVSFVGVDHPVAKDDTPLSRRQKILGWLAILIFILCFSPSPLYLL